MHIIVCLDNRKGMLFNYRRQSRDKEIVKRIIEQSAQKVKMSEYSARIFENFQEYIEVDNQFLEKASVGDVCFIENADINDLTDIESITIYNWNKMYPADKYFTLSLENFQLIHSEEFKGNSHEKITKEVYLNAQK